MDSSKQSVKALAWAVDHLHHLACDELHLIYVLPPLGAGNHPVSPAGSATSLTLDHSHWTDNRRQEEQQAEEVLKHAVETAVLDHKVLDEGRVGAVRGRGAIELCFYVCGGVPDPWLQVACVAALTCVCVNWVCGVRVVSCKVAAMAGHDYEGG